MKRNRIYRAVAIVAAAFLAAGALGGCAAIVTEPPKLVSLGPIEGGPEEGLDGLEDDTEGDSSNVDESAPSPQEMDLAAEIGRCFTADDVISVADEVFLVTKDCADSHDAEFFHAFESAAAQWDATEITGEAAQVCNAAFESYTASDISTTELDFWFFAPTAASWETGHRQIACFVIEPELIESSAKGSGR